MLQRPFCNIQVVVPPLAVWSNSPPWYDPARGRLDTEPNCKTMKCEEFLLMYIVSGLSFEVCHMTGTKFKSDHCSFVLAKALYLGNQGSWTLILMWTRLLLFYMDDLLSVIALQSHEVVMCRSKGRF